MKTRSFILKVIMFGIVCLFLIACTNLIVKVENDDEWSGYANGKIMLQYRRIDFSEEKSPSWDQVAYIVDAQNLYYAAIQDSIGRQFSDRVTIYLYNHDEAIEKIGTNGGGHALPKFNTYYYTFIDSNRSITDQFGIVDPYIGAHELVHVITHRTLGYPGTKLLSEGYAVWLDGTYARYHIDEIMVSYRDNAPEKILSPDQLLDEAYEHPAAIYYPNCGVFTRYLIHTYGIETINSLFTANEEAFKSQFEYVSNDTWLAMCEGYSTYVDSLRFISEQ